MASKFSSSVIGWGFKTTNQMEEIYREAGLEGFRILKRRSPVDTGNFRANWRVGLNAPDLTTDESVTRSQFGDEPNNNEMRPARSVLHKAKLKDTIFETNALPFALKIERGLSKSMAPQGVVALGLEELRLRFPSIARSVTRRIK